MFKFDLFIKRNDLKRAFNKLIASQIQGILLLAILKVEDRAKYYTINFVKWALNV